MAGGSAWWGPDWDRHRPVLRHLRQFAGQLLRIERPGLGRPGDRAALPAELPRPLGGGHCPRGLRGGALARDPAGRYRHGAVARRHGRAGVRGALPGSGAPTGQHFRHARRLAVRHRAALHPAGGHHRRPGLAAGQLHGRPAAPHRAWAWRASLVRSPIAPPRNGSSASTAQPDQARPRAQQSPSPRSSRCRVTWSRRPAAG